MADIGLTVTYFAILLGFGVLIANLLKKSRVPDTFFLLLLGLVLGPTLWKSSFLPPYLNIQLIDVSLMDAVPDFLRLLALIMIVFTGTFNLSFKMFKRFSNISINLAFVGVIFNTIFLGLIAHFIFGFDLIYSLLLGSIISGTDPSVIVPFERVLNKSRKATTILKVESIFNSPLSVLLPVLFLDLVALQPGALINPLKYLSQFWLMIVAGIGTGIVIGFSVSKLLKIMLKEYSPLLLFSIALITYALAENVGGSGMLAVAVCGLVAGNITLPNREEVKHFDDQFSELLRISVFTLLGAQVFLSFNLQEIFLVLLFFLFVFFSRPIFLMPLLGKRKNEFNRNDIFLLNFIAPRGVSPAAITPIVTAVIIGAGQKAIADSFINIIFMIILLSVLLSTLVAEIISFSYKRLENEKKEDVQENKEDVQIKVY